MFLLKKPKNTSFVQEESYFYQRLLNITLSIIINI